MSITPPGSRFLNKKFALRGLAVLGILSALIILGHFVGDEIPTAEAWLEDQGVWAPLIFTVAFCLLPLFVFPTDPLCFSAGALFGMVSGLLFAGIGMLVSASLMFIIARYLARGRMEKIFFRHPRFKLIDRAVEQRGTRIMLLLRVAPIPFSPLSYFLGITPVRFREYFLTIFGTSATVIAGVYFGYIANHVTKLAGHAERFSNLHEILLFSGLLLALVAVAGISHESHRILKELEAI